MDYESMCFASSAARSISELEKQSIAFLEGTLDEKTLRETFWVYLLSVRAWHKEYSQQQINTMLDSCRGMLP